MQLSHDPRPLSDCHSVRSIFRYLFNSTVARRVFSAPRSGRRLALARPEFNERSRDEDRDLLLLSSGTSPTLTIS